MRGQDKGFLQDRDSTEGEHAGTVETVFQSRQDPETYSFLVTNVRE